MWVTLDSDDNDPRRLWTYIATAVERIRPGLAHPVLQRLEVHGGRSSTPWTSSSTILGRSRKPAILVLDDLHTVTDPDSLATIDRALRHMPDNLRLVIGTRVDPPLAIPRLRADQQLTSCAPGTWRSRWTRHALCSSSASASHLTSDQVAALVERTQGWPAMLVLSGIWLRGVDDPASAVSRFGGEQRFVADYLSTEVLAALDDERRDSCRGSPCSVTSRPRSAMPRCSARARSEMIDDLVREGLFVSRLEQGDWFRIHPLFAEYAQLELEAAEPGAAQAGSTTSRPVAGTTPGRSTRCCTHPQLVSPRWSPKSAGGAPPRPDPQRSRTHGPALGRHPARRGADSAYPEVAVAAGISRCSRAGARMNGDRYLGLVEQAISRGPRTSGRIRGRRRADRTHRRARRWRRARGGAGRRAVEMTQQGTSTTLADGALTAYGRALYFAGDLDGARGARPARAGASRRRRGACRRTSTRTRPWHSSPSMRAGSRPRRRTSTRPRNWSGRSARAEAGWVRTSLRPSEPCCSRRAGPLKPPGSWQPPSGCFRDARPRPCTTRGSCCCWPGRSARRGRLDDAARRPAWPATPGRDPGRRHPARAPDGGRARDRLGERARERRAR